MNSIEPSKPNISKYLFLVFVIVFSFAYSWIKNSSFYLGFLVTILLAIIIIKERYASFSVRKIASIDDQRFLIVLKEKNIEREIIFNKQEGVFSIKKIVNGKMLEPYYETFIKIEEKVKIKLAPYQGWESGKLMDFFDKNGIKYTIT